MKSGEQIIADIQEMVVENKAVGYYLTKPCIVQLLHRERDETTEKMAFDINLLPWIPLAKGETVPISMDWVITYVDPVDMLLEMYQENVINSTKSWGEGMNRPSENEND